MIYPSIPRQWRRRVSAERKLHNQWLSADSIFASWLAACGSPGRSCRASFNWAMDSSGGRTCQHRAQIHVRVKRVGMLFDGVLNSRRRHPFRLRRLMYMQETASLVGIRLEKYCQF